MFCLFLRLFALLVRLFSPRAVIVVRVFPLLFKVRSEQDKTADNSNRRRHIKNRQDDRPQGSDQERRHERRHAAGRSGLRHAGDRKV